VNPRLLGLLILSVAGIGWAITALLRRKNGEGWMLSLIMALAHLVGIWLAVLIYF